MKTIRYLLLSIIFLVIITIAAFLSRWFTGKGITPLNIPRISSDLKIEGVRLTRVAGGKTEWELKARSADYFRDKGVTHLESPEVVFYGKSDLRIELKGNSGEVFNSSNDVKVSGDVKIVTSDGYTFRSDSLFYSSGEKTVSTESRVTLKGNGIDVEGLGMVADTEMSRVLIKRHVRAVLEGRI